MSSSLDADLSRVTRGAEVAKYGVLFFCGGLWLVVLWSLTSNFTTHVSFYTNIPLIIANLMIVVALAGLGAIARAAPYRWATEHLPAPAALQIVEHYDAQLGSRKTGELRTAIGLPLITISAFYALAEPQLAHRLAGAQLSVRDMLIVDIASDRVAQRKLILQDEQGTVKIPVDGPLLRAAETKAIGRVIVEGTNSWAGFETLTIAAAPK